MIIPNNKIILHNTDKGIVINDEIQASGFDSGDS